MPKKSNSPTIIQTKLIPFLKTPLGKIALGIIAVIVLLLIILQSIPHGGGSIEDIARQQLNDIKNGDIDKAYSLTSKVFQQKNSFDVFNGYLTDNAIFKQYKNVSFDQNKIDNGVGYLKGSLEGEDGSKEGIELQLVREDDQWRVQVFQVTGSEGSASVSGNNAAASDASGASIHDLLISDSADLDGYVQDVKMTIPSSAPKIFITAEVVAPSSGSGAKIQALLKLPTMHGKMGPSISDVAGSGDILKAFAFVRSGSSWPTGDYSVTVTLSTGATMTQKFQVQ
jgi:hypothetical protein